MKALRVCRPAFLAFVVCALLAPAAVAQNNQCDQAGEAPDVIVGDLHQERRWGTANGMTAFTIGTTSCNIGTCWLNWTAGNNNHPVIGESMYRLKDGRFEQLGQSWLKHGFFALSGSLCDNGCLSTNGTHLGVNCSDPYSANRNGSQNGLGPKFEVNPSTGVFPYPPTDGNNTGNVIYKRIQVDNDDLDPALNVGAQYFVDGHYVTKDDAAAGNQNNNSSYRPITVFQSGTIFDINLTGTTQREKPAIQAWQDSDPTVQLTFVDVPNDGRFIVGAKVTDLGGGMWHYEYAVQNLNSDRAAREFSVPIPAGAVAMNVGFHDVPYHSGEPWDGTDWAASLVGNELAWATSTFTQNSSANALRWGTIYNYRFDATAPPIDGQAELVLFKPGTPATMGVDTMVPGMALGSPSPIPDGEGVTRPLRGDRLSPAGDVIGVKYDPACPAHSFNLIYGDLFDVGSYAIQGAECSVGTSGFYTWSNVPAGNLYYLLVGTDEFDTESSWGVTSQGVERNGMGSSGQCGVTMKNVGETCP